MKLNTRTLAALIATLLFQVQGGGAAVNLTLENAVQSATSKNPAAQTARERLIEGEQSYPITRALVLPTLTAQLDYNFRKDPLNLGQPLFGGESYNFYSFGLKFMQPLYSGGGVSAGLSSSKKELEIRQREVSIADRDLTLRVLQSFYGVLIQQRRIETLERNLAFEKELASTAQVKYRQGTARLLELLSIKTQLALLEPNIERARGELKVRAAERAQLIGDPNVSELQVTATLDPAPWDQVEAAAKADDRTPSIPELEKIKIAQEQAIDNKEMNLAKHFPQLRLVGTWGREAYVKADLLDSFSTRWTAGLSLEVPIFSGLSSIYERRKFASQIALLSIEEARLRDQFALSQIQARKDIELAKTVVAANREALKLANDAMKEARTTYRLGTSTYQQLFDAEQRQTEAEFQYDQARYEAIVSQARFFIASGWRLAPLVQLLSVKR